VKLVVLVDSATSARFADGVDAPVLVAVDVLTKAASVSRSNLLEVARALVEARAHRPP
jgi:hypothetical protein